MPKPGVDGLYTITLHGEQHTYQLRGTEQHTLVDVCKTLSDLTGYKGEYLRNELLDRMPIGHKERVKIAMLWDGETPYFVVKRVS